MGRRSFVMDVSKSYFDMDILDTCLRNRFLQHDTEDTKTLRTFSLFPDLRPEIKLQIWKYVITDQEDQEAKILEVYPCRDYSNHRICAMNLRCPVPKSDGLKGNYHVHHQNRSGSRLLALAATNSEARHEVQQYIGTITCTSSNANTHAEITYYNLRIDTIAIRYQDLIKMTGNKNLESIHGLDKITKLLVLHRCCLCGPHCVKLTANALSALMAPLASLNELYIEFDDTGPRSGRIERFSPSKPEKYPNSYIEQLRKEFEVKKAQVIEDRKRKGGSVIRVIELVTCDRQWERD